MKNLTDFRKTVETGMDPRLILATRRLKLEIEFFTFHLPSLAFFRSKKKSKISGLEYLVEIRIGKIITFEKLKIASKIFW